MLDGRRDQVAATFRTGDIAVIRDGLASTRPNEVGDLFRYRGVLPEPRYVGPQVVHHDPGPAFGEEFDVCPPQPAACPSHNRDLPLQRNSFGHLAILVGNPGINRRCDPSESVFEGALRSRPKLLRIPAFAWGYGYWRMILNLIRASRVWQAAS